MEEVSKKNKVILFFNFYFHYYYFIVPSTSTTSTCNLARCTLYSLVEVRVLNETTRKICTEIRHTSVCGFCFLFSFVFS